MKRYNNWEEVFASAKPMKFNAFNTGRITGKVKTYADTTSNGFSLEPFEKVLDVFGDGSFFAVSTPGHTKDHISYLINKQPTPQFIIGDAELNRWAVGNGIKVNTDYGKQGKKDVYK